MNFTAPTCQIYSKRWRSSSTPRDGCNDHSIDASDSDRRSGLGAQLGAGWRTRLRTELPMVPAGVRAHDVGCLEPLQRRKRARKYA